MKIYKVSRLLKQLKALLGRRQFISAAAAIWLIAGALPRSAMAQSDEILVNTLLQVSSVASSPLWFPDGSKILFSSSFNRGSLMSISPDGGFPKRLPINLGGTGHFLTPHGEKISPDGKWISYMSDKSGFPEIWIWSPGEGRDLQLTNLGGRVNAMSWSPDSRWIAFSCDRYGNFDIWKVAVPGGEVYRLTSEKNYEVYPTWTPDSKKILYARLDERWVDHDLIEISANGQNPRLVLSDKDFFDYMWGRTFGYSLVSANGKMVLFRSHRSGWINYWIVPLAGGEPRQIAPAEADQSQALWSPDGKQIAYIENHNGTLDLRLVSAAGGKPQVLVSPAIGMCGNPEWSPDSSHICYTFNSPILPGDLYLVSLKSGERKQLTFSSLEGNFEKFLVMPEKITYSSSDGLMISAYLYKPAAIRPNERFPGLVWIHGGPTSQFSDSLQADVQFFVQQGYVCLLPNIRGSSGYGKKFEDANNKCWGECDLKDVVAGVEYLKSLPFVDAKAIGITGTSYGGVMSMAAVTFAPDVFQAAIPCSGYCDYIRSVEESEWRHGKLWDYEMGPWKENEELYRKLSPYFHVEKVSTPTLVICGEGLYPGSPQSKYFVEQLEKYYKVFKFIPYPDEMYYVRKHVPEMRIEMLKWFDKFLKKSNIVNP